MRCYDDLLKRKPPAARTIDLTVPDTCAPPMNGAAPLNPTGLGNWRKTLNKPLA